MTNNDIGTILVTGPTGGLGRALVLDLAGRPEPERPDLLLVGRAGEKLTEITGLVRAAGATAEPISCDLSQLADVRAAGQAAKDLLASGAVRPLRGLVAIAGVIQTDTRIASADGYQMTFAINYLAHAQLIGALLDSFTPPARIILLGSNTYRGGLVRRLMVSPPPNWRDPIEIARPATGKKAPGIRAANVAYATSKLALIYYAHELQRHAGDQINVTVYEPGFMPATGIVRDYSPMLRALARKMAHLPGTSSPERAAPALASLILDDRWAHLRGGAFVEIDKEVDVLPFAHNHEREVRLWEATDELLKGSAIPKMRLGASGRQLSVPMTGR